jgi:hypothetical protein
MLQQLKRHDHHHHQIHQIQEFHQVTYLNMARSFVAVQLHPFRHQWN